MDSQSTFNAENVTTQTLKAHPLTDDIKQAAIDSIKSQRDAGNFMTMFKMIDHDGNQLTNSERYQLAQWLEHLGFVTSGCFSLTSDVLSIYWGPMANELDPWRSAD